MARQRPDVIRWLWYSLGGRLPERYREWILHDATTGGWRRRHVARSTVMIAPLCAVWLLLPGPLPLRLALVLMAALVAYFYSMAYMEESIEHRLGKHGFPPGTGRRTRAEATALAEADVTERYLARYRNQTE